MYSIPLSAIKTALQTVIPDIESKLISDIQFEQNYLAVTLFDTDDQGVPKVSADGMDHPTTTTRYELCRHR